MKKSFITVMGMFLAAIALMAFAFPSATYTNPPQEKATIFPEDVQPIVETSCFDCHSDAASNKKAKSKLNLSKWANYSDSKKVGKLESISEVVTKGDMPPNKYLNKYPEKALTKDQKDIMNKWVNETTTKLMGE